MRALVGEVAFNNALEALKEDKDIVAAGTAVPITEKKKRTRNITDEQREVIRNNMAALQAFTKVVREELGDSVAYADAKKTAGERWKGMSKEEKDAWVAEHPVTDAPAAPTEEKTVVIAAAEEPKKGRGRPKKEAGAEVKVSKE